MGGENKGFVAWNSRRVPANYTGSKTGSEELEFAGCTGFFEPIFEPGRSEERPFSKRMAGNLGRVRKDYRLGVRKLTMGDEELSPVR